MRTLGTFDQRHTNISCKDWLRPLCGNELSQHINGVVFSNFDTLKGCRRTLWHEEKSCFGFQHVQWLQTFQAGAAHNPFREKCCAEVLTKLLSGEDSSQSLPAWSWWVVSRDRSYPRFVFGIFNFTFDTFWQNSCWTDFEPSAVFFSWSGVQ